MTQETNNLHTPIDNIRLSASTMMWSMDIDVSLVSEDKLRLVLKEESVSSRTETIEWDVSEPPYDLFSQVSLCNR